MAHLLDIAPGEECRMIKGLMLLANMIEASVQTPERFPGPQPDSDEADRKLRVVALLRALTSDEGAALLRHKQLPERLEDLADTVGLAVDDCKQILRGAAYNLAEGPRLRLPDSEDPARPEAAG